MKRLMVMNGEGGMWLNGKEIRVERSELLRKVGSKEASESIK